VLGSTTTTTTLVYNDTKHSAPFKTSQPGSTILEKTRCITFSPDPPRSTINYSVSSDHL